MKYCEKCKVKVDTNLIRCPLCSAVLATEYEPADTVRSADTGYEVEIEASDENGLSNAIEAMPGNRSDENHDGLKTGSPRYPGTVTEVVHKYNFTLRLLLFISVVIASTCLLINILTYSGVLWSGYVAGTLLYIWITVGYPVIKKRKLGQIIVLNTIATAIYVYSLELATETQGWGLTYVTPFLFIASTLFITFVILLKRLKWREYAVYQTVMVIMGFLPVIFSVAGLVTEIWPSVFSAFYSFITVIGMLIFGDKKYKDELIKRFHL